MLCPHSLTLFLRRENGAFCFISFILADYEADIVSGKTIIRLYEYLLQRGSITSLILRVRSLL